MFTIDEYELILRTFDTVRDTWGGLTDKEQIVYDKIKETLKASYLR